MSESSDYEFFAGVIHGVTAFGHALGLLHALRRKLKFDGAMHGAALIYDSWAAYKHFKEYNDGR